ncbi:periplasmic binding protein-like I [Obelidium mucronatum]|nr:periplasmic binding protein-like I [Obelidium mucronatum]
MSNDSITIAFVGPYSWYPGLTIVDRVVTAGWDTLNMSQYRDFYGNKYPQFFYWLDVMAELAVKRINETPLLLPGVLVKIKRFNTFDPNRVAEVATSLQVDSGGYAATTVEKIYTEHPDVIALFGDYIVNGAIFTAAVSSFYQLPFINPAAWSVPLLDRNKFAYFMQMCTMSGSGKAVALLLQTWNIRRVAIIYKMNDLSWSTVTLEMMDILQSHGVSILTTLNINDGNTDDGIKHLADSLKNVDARYIIIMSDAVQVGNVYYKLAKQKYSVGDNYVWMGMNFPLMDPTSPFAIENPKYYMLSRGFISFSGFNLYNSFMGNITDQMLNTLDALTNPHGFSIDFYEAWYGNLFPAYDCIMTLASGFHNLAVRRDNGVEHLATRSLQPLMNSTLFEATGYRGFSGDPLLLSSQGDLRASWNFFTLSGDTSTPNPVNFGATDIDLTVFDFLDTLPIFYDGSHIPPHDGSILQNEIYVSADSQFGLILLTMASVGIAFSLACGTLAIKYRHNKAMKKGSTSFKCLIAIGAIPLFLGQLTYLRRPTPFACTARVWTFLLSLTLVFSAYTLKNLRLYFIFNAKTNLAKYIVKDDFYLLGVVGTMVGSVVLLQFWTLYAQPTVLLTQLTNTTFTYICSVKNAHNQTIPLVWIYHGALVILQAALGFATVNIEAGYNQSGGLYSLSILAGIVAVLLFGDYQSSFQHAWLSRIQVVCVWCVAMMALFIEFVPKVVEMVLEQRQSMMAVAKRGGGGGGGGGGRGNVSGSGAPNSLQGSRTAAAAAAAAVINKAAAASVGTMKKIKNFARFTAILSSKPRKSSLLWAPWTPVSVVLCSLDQNRMQINFLSDSSSFQLFALYCTQDVVKWAVEEENRVVLTCLQNVGNKCPRYIWLDFAESNSANAFVHCLGRKESSLQ